MKWIGPVAAALGAMLAISSGCNGKVGDPSRDPDGSIWQPDASFREPEEYIWETVPQGCQDLRAIQAQSSPIRLQGTLLGAYLPDRKTYTQEESTSGPDWFEICVLDLATSRLERRTFDERNDTEVAVPLNPAADKSVWIRRPYQGAYGQDEVVLGNGSAGQSKVIAAAGQPDSQYGYFGIPGFVPPNGDTVLVSAYKNGAEFSGIALIDTKTNEIRDLNTPFAGNIADPQMSPDGKRIAFKSPQADDEDIVHLYIMNADGKGIRQLTHGDYRDEDPAISPDGKTVVFERTFDNVIERSGGWFFNVTIYSLDLETGEERLLVPTDPCGKNELWLPTWSTDGEFIMFTRGLHLENGQFVHDLWVMRKDGRDLQRVPNSDGIVFFDAVFSGAA